MEKKKKLNDAVIPMIIFAVMMIVFFMMGKTENGEINTDKIKALGKNSNSLNIISGAENKDLESIVLSYANSKGYKVNIEYAGALDIMQKLNNGEQYDAVWLSNSIWMYMLDSSKVSTVDSKCTSINPVIFGVTKSKAEELGFTNKTIYTKDIVKAISDGNLKFSMSNPTSTDSGASAYLGMLYTLAGNPEVLTKENLEDDKVRESLKTLFSGMERSSGSEEFLEELFLKGDYEAVVTYESSIININKQLIANNKEPLYAIYPVDGVSISDSPFAFIKNNNEDKKAVFDDIQSYIIGNEGQKLLQQKGRRTWFGGVSKNTDKTIFNPDWGIDTTKYISPVKYPSTSVIKLALNAYQTELRKPTHVVFCLDYSGSMYGNGYTQLINAMEYILTEKAAADMIQFSDKDKIDVIPFGDRVYDIYSTDKGSQTSEVLTKIKSQGPNGMTALYPAAIKGLEILKNEDLEKYNVSIVLMTDGLANIGTYKQLESVYKMLNKQIPIYSIMFGSASDYQLNDIAKLSNAKIFDGKTDLVRAFKEVRGYN